METMDASEASKRRRSSKAMRGLLELSSSQHRTASLLADFTNKQNLLQELAPHKIKERNPEPTYKMDTMDPPEASRRRRRLLGLSCSHHRRPSMLADGSIAKTFWPELVGKSAAEAARMLRMTQPFLFIEVLDMNDTDDLTLEYDAQRVQLFVDSSGQVLYAPQVG
jgi:hypothetical protein